MQRKEELEGGQQREEELQGVNAVQVSGMNFNQHSGTFKTSPCPLAAYHPDNASLLIVEDPLHERLCQRRLA